MPCQLVRSVGLGMVVCETGIPPPEQLLDNLQQPIGNDPVLKDVLVGAVAQQVCESQCWTRPCLSAVPQLSLSARTVSSVSSTG
jgi:hypothetical protein